MLLITGLYIRTEKWAEAVGVLLRFAAACDATNAIVSQCKAYLGAVVVWLFANDGAQAWAVYQVQAQHTLHTLQEAVRLFHHLTAVQSYADGYCITVPAQLYSIFSNLPGDWASRLRLA